MPPDSPVAGSPIAHQAGRALTAWLSNDEAVIRLLGRPSQPSDDLTEVNQRLADRRDALASLSAFVPRNPIVVAADRSALDAAAAHPKLQATFGAADWRLEIIDLTAVQSMQQMIKTDGLEVRVAPVVEDETHLLELCLPVNQPPEQLTVFIDGDQRGFTVSSLNPNLRIAGGQVFQTEVASADGGPTIPIQAIAILVALNASYVQVAHYAGRYFLRDGYHRAAGLIRAGITKIPCVYLEIGGNFEQVIPGTPGLFNYETCFAERPPLVVDFWDPTLSDSITQPEVRKVVRVTGEEFVVQG